MGKMETDFNFGFDDDNLFGDDEFNKIDICGLVKKLKRNERKMFDVNNEVKQLDGLIASPPADGEVYKLLSIAGGFSSIAVIKFVAKFEVIEQLYCSTFRIGRKQFEVIEQLNDCKRILKANFITSTTQKNTDTDYAYYEYICESCKNRGFGLKIFNNHSKLILMKTKKNYYVVETSSNLNENPKIEQFSFENDKELFLWYEEFFKELMK